MRSKKYTEMEKEERREKLHSKVDSVMWCLISFFSGMIFMLVILYRLWV